MKTYVTVSLHSEGGKASLVSQKLKDLGFDTTFGTHDFVYDWKDKDVSPSEIILFADQIQTKLEGMNVRLNITTV